MSGTFTSWGALVQALQKEVAEATISAIKDIELADKAYGELQSLAEKTKEVGKENNGK